MNVVVLLMSVARWVVFAAQLVLAVPVGYLCLIALVALGVHLARHRSRHRTPPQARAVDQPATHQRLTRFAVIVPAHNEEALLGRTLASLSQQTYPCDRYQVVVIADNCTDRTAQVAGAHAGVWVYERHDLANRGKGQALRWLFERLEAEGRIFDAYMILDADSLADPDLLEGMARRIAGGARAVQVHNTVRNADEAPSAALRWYALQLHNHVIPSGRTALGGSAQLGNGMCVTRALLQRYPWQAAALAEDLQYYLTLVQAGERVDYAPDVAVRNHMPTTFGQMRTQDIRWEAPLPHGQGWRATWRLLRDGLRRRDIVRLEAFVARLVPPLSTTLAAWLLTTVAALALGAWAQVWFGVALGAALFVYMASALLFERPPRMLWRALLFAPGFAFWKVWVALVLSRRKKHTTTWIRTARPTSVFEGGAPERSTT